MLPHTLITASAGSGKTWNLTVRYLRLVMMGADPGSIVALTFSRKAAGEFFDAIIHRLAQAAASPEAAAELARDICQPEATAADFGHALMRLIHRMPGLMLGTLDSFFVRLARSFPLELGLAGGFSLLDPHAESVQKLRVYERVFAPQPGTVTSRRDFMQAFTEATWGKEELSIQRRLDEFVRDWHSLFLAAPRAGQWGDPSTLWPGRPAPVSDPDLRRHAVQRLEQSLARQELTAGQRARWQDFLTDSLCHTAGAPLSKPLKYLLPRALSVLTQLEAGHATLTVDRRKQDLEGPGAEALAQLCQDFIAAELEVVLRQTRGIFEVIRKYESSWHEMVRRQGQLTFQDVQLILGGGLGGDSAGATPSPEGSLTRRENRQLMEYRLDSRYHHWLLDEFQDTSRIQWKVLANLVDEAVQDSEQLKSFFAVGDQKQSIYEWRGGTPALFDELERQYNPAPRGSPGNPLQIQPLSVSQRSGPAVIGMVNDLLNPEGPLAEVMPPAAVASWPWQVHTSRNTRYQGTALVLEVPDESSSLEEVAEEAGAPGSTYDNSGGNPAGGDSGEEENEATDPRWQRTADLLVQLQPLQRGLTCAVLCHRNPRALALADYLRHATGLEVVCESDLSMAHDNPATSSLLALLQSAAHPADSFAWEQVLMSPLAEVIVHLHGRRSDGTVAPAASLRQSVCRQILTDIVRLGFHDTFRKWIAALLEVQPDLDAFSRGRLEEWCGCALAFDATGSRDPDEFRLFAEAWSVREAGQAGAIQVMTVHRSKGLTFDLVVIPDLHDRMFRSGHPLGMEQSADGSIKWLLRLPPRWVADADPVLKEAIETAEASRWRERMAGLYVMVTRARYANYVLVKPAPARPSAAPSLTKLVHRMLARETTETYTLCGEPLPIVAKYGDPDWYLAHPLAGASNLPQQNCLPLPQALPPGKVPERHRRAAPHASAATDRPEQDPVQLDLFSSPPPARKLRIPLQPAHPSAGSGDDFHFPLFPSTRQEAQNHGTEIHQLLARIEWWSGRPFAEAGPRSGPGPGTAQQEVEDCLRSPAWDPFFRCPEENIPEVWREKAFDVILGGQWFSGVFDRVLIFRDSCGHPVKAILCDFKTGPPPTPGSPSLRHHPQLEQYRRALAQLLQLAVNSVETFLLFTRTAQVLPL